MCPQLGSLALVRPGNVIKEPGCVQVYALNVLYLVPTKYLILYAWLQLSIISWKIPLKNVQIWSEDVFFSPITVACDLYHRSSDTYCHGKRALNKLISRKNCTTSPPRLGNTPGTKHEKLIWRLRKVVFAMDRKVPIVVWFPSPDYSPDCSLMSIA